MATRRRNTTPGGGTPPPDPSPGGGGTRTDLPQFKLVFDEEFPQTVTEGGFLSHSYYGPRWYAYPNNALDTYGKWARDNGRTDQSHYDPSRLSVSAASSGGNGNSLKMRLGVGSDGVGHGNAPFPKLAQQWPYSSLLYGRYEARLRCANPVQGWKTAWLLWPDSGNWPPDGEIDFPEGALTGSMGAFMHRQNGTSGSDQDHYGSTVTYLNWHTLVLEWRPNFCQFSIDGNAIGTSTNRVPNTRMHWLMQTETNLPGGSRPIAGQECTLEVDYVALWAYAP
jgi:hypothetical protein